jgi:nicotinamidase-related amidase
VGPVVADPYPWPYHGSVPADRVALLCIDWQVDFCGPGGYVERMGYDHRPHPGRAARSSTNDRGYECLVLSDCVGSYFPNSSGPGWR